ncbi:MAG: PilZ domain-containing protein [Polyangiaceae bacterium]|nr:PilZ domain-containing protein [Polyangiaceae bacterium]
MEGGTQERRTHLRVPATLAVEYEIPGVAARPATVVDIGLGGTRLESMDPPPPGSPLTVVLQLPGARDKSRLAATVRWSRGRVFGLAFGVLLARDTHLIVDLMRSNLRSRPPPPPDEG